MSPCIRGGFLFIFLNYNVKKTKLKTHLKTYLENQKHYLPAPLSSLWFFHRSFDINSQENVLFQ